MGRTFQKYVDHKPFLFVILKVTSTNANVSQEIIRAANFQFKKAPSKLVRTIPHPDVDMNRIE